MNNQQPLLLHCPNCKKRQRTDYVILGSITSEGFFVMTRKHNRLTMIVAQDYTVVCDCGYMLRINEGRIDDNSLSVLTMNG